jgi:hypothetical protein
LITGATDDDPSGISIYSVAGTAYGYGTLWIALLTCSGGCSILVVAKVINIGADLGGMAEATQRITGIRPLVYIPVYALLGPSSALRTHFRLGAI